MGIEINYLWFILEVMRSSDGDVIGRVGSNSVVPVTVGQIEQIKGLIGKALLVDSQTVELAGRVLELEACGLVDLSQSQGGTVERG